MRLPTEEEIKILTGGKPFEVVTLFPLMTPEQREKVTIPQFYFLFVDSKGELIDGQNMGEFTSIFCVDLEYDGPCLGAIVSPSLADNSAVLSHEIFHLIHLYGEYLKNELNFTDSLQREELMAYSFGYVTYILSGQKGGYSLPDWELMRPDSELLYFKD